MTWNHPRGIDPLVACSRVWRERTGVEVSWDARTLQDFESYPVKSLAETYDLIVIDHPHVGQITREQCLVPLAVEPPAAVGASSESYFFEQRLWALPIDAAAQVQAFRPDRLAAPMLEWSEVLKLAATGVVHCPMRPPHSLMTLYTLCGLLGRSGNVYGPDLIDSQTGRRAYELMRELIGHLDAECFAMDPIAVLDAMSQTESRVHCVPLIYGYVSYARADFRPARIAFADIPVVEKSSAPVGSALGGTGIAVSAFSRHRSEAMKLACWLASADCQRGIYAQGGGQPGHSSAWQDPAVNEPVFDFYRNTRATLEGAWVRPRHHGYMSFQATASETLNAALRKGAPAAFVISEINRLFRDSLESA
jgi:multiple sugar transport system substrate-binding protein